MFQVLFQALMIYCVYLHLKFKCSTNRIIILSLKNLINLPVCTQQKNCSSSALFISYQKMYIVFGHREAPDMENVQVTGVGGS